MPWKKMSLNQIAKSLGVDLQELREKQRLSQLIIKVRKQKGLSQKALAAKVGVTQGRIAQIESGMGTAKISFDVLLHILTALGYQFKIMMKKAA